MASLTEFIEGRLRLKVNEAKSAVARPEDRHFLGFRLRLDPQTGVVEVLLSERTKRNAMERVRQLTPRNWGSSLADCIAQINAWLRGWHGFFGIASRRGDADDAQDRRPYPATVARAHSAPLETPAHDRAAPRRAGCEPEGSVEAGLSGPQVLVGAEPRHAVDQGLRNAFFAKRGLGLRGRLASPEHTSTSPPPTRHNWRYGDDFEVANPAGSGVSNPLSRGAVYEQRTYGSVGAGTGNRPGYLSEDPRGRVAREGVGSGSKARELRLGGRLLGLCRCQDQRHRLDRQVAALDQPLVVLLGEQRADEPDHGVVVGEDPDDVGAAADLLVDPLQRVRGPQLGPVLGREAVEGDQVLLGRLEQARTPSARRRRAARARG